MPNMRANELAGLTPSLRTVAIYLISGKIGPIKAGYKMASGRNVSPSDKHRRYRENKYG